MATEQKKRILIAEDEENILEAVTTVLQESFEITPAGRGDRALQLFRAGSYDLVISDVRMPGIDGVELFKEVKRLHPEQKFIFISVSSLFEDDPEARDILSNRADAFLSKPYRIPQLIKLINEVLGLT